MCHWQVAGLVKHNDKGVVPRAMPRGLSNTMPRKMANSISGQEQRGGPCQAQSQGACPTLSASVENAMES